MMNQTIVKTAIDPRQIPAARPIFRVSVGSAPGSFPALGLDVGECDVGAASTLFVVLVPVVLLNVAPAV